MARHSNWLLMRAIERVSRPDIVSTQRGRRPGQKTPLEADHSRAERAGRASGRGGRQQSGRLGVPGSLGEKRDERETR